MIGVSACLLGKRCRYDGGDKLNREVAAMCGGCEHIAFCPELLAGFPVPREAADVDNGCGADVITGRARVLTKSGRDVTAGFLLGAVKSLELCKAHGITRVYFKAKSPSCGKECGVAAALLRKNGIEVYEY